MLHRGMGACPPFRARHGMASTWTRPCPSWPRPVQRKDGGGAQAAGEDAERRLTRRCGEAAGRGGGWQRRCRDCGSTRCPEVGVQGTGAVCRYLAMLGSEPTLAPALPRCLLSCQGACSPAKVPALLTLPCGAVVLQEVHGGVLPLGGLCATLESHMRLAPNLEVLQALEAASRCTSRKWRHWQIDVCPNMPGLLHQPGQVWVHAPVGHALAAAGFWLCRGYGGRTTADPGFAAELLGGALAAQRFELAQGLLLHCPAAVDKLGRCVLFRDERKDGLHLPRVCLHDSCRLHAGCPVAGVPVLCRVVGCMLHCCAGWPHLLPACRPPVCLALRHEAPTALISSLVALCKERRASSGGAAEADASVGHPGQLAIQQGRQDVVVRQAAGGVRGSGSRALQELWLSGGACAADLPCQCCKLPAAIRHLADPTGGIPPQALSLPPTPTPTPMHPTPTNPAAAQRRHGAGVRDRTEAHHAAVPRRGAGPRDHRPAPAAPCAGHARGPRRRGRLRRHPLRRRHCAV